ncbi:hypothetical protein TWF281_006871 [Arthrobotrys megalospora]
MFGDTPGPAPSRAATATAAAVKRFKKLKSKPPISKPTGTTILSLPMEIHEEILGHLLWYDHFAVSMVCPEWATILQLPKFREKRYCIETWTETKSPDLDDIDLEDFEDLAENMAMPDNMDFHRYHPDDTSAKDLDLGPGGLGMHGLLGTGTMILSVRETGEARVYLAVRQMKDTWKGKDRGDYAGPMMRPYEEMLPFDVGVRRCRWKNYKHKVEISFHEITGSPLLATDSQFYFGTETNEKVPEHVQAKIKKHSKERYWANDSDTWGEILEREDDISVRILNKDFLTDGIHSRVRRRCDFEYMDETTIPSVLPLPATSVDTGTTVQKLLEYIKDALIDEQDLDGDGPVECWATFQEFWPQRRSEIGPEDAEFHPRRKIFLSLWNLSRWSLDPKKEDMDCTCDGDARHCACQWMVNALPYIRNQMGYKYGDMGSGAYESSDDEETQSVI